MAHALVANLPHLTDRGLAEAYLAGAVSAEADLSWAAIFPWEHPTFTAVGYAPPSGYADATDGENIATESVDETYAATITVAEASLGYACSMLANLTMRRETMVGLYKQLGALAVRFFAAELYDLLNNAVATNGPDGVPLGSASHPSAAGLQSNYINSSLAFASYESAVRTLRLTQNHRGTVMGLRPTKLIVPSALDVTANRVLNATYRSADWSDITRPQGTQGVATTISSDLTSATRWFVCDESACSFRIPVVRGPGPWVIDFEQYSGRHEVRDKVAAGFGYLDWRGCVVG